MKYSRGFANRKGFTQRYTCKSDEYYFNLLIRPNTYTDERFKAYSIDDESFIMINGWLVTDIDESEMFRLGRLTK